jgi:ATP-binding cassette subfamily F protein 3
VARAILRHGFFAFREGDMPVLAIHNLGKYFGADFIFGNVSFQVEKGEKVALVGVNGAGKSTILKIVAGVESADSGKVHMARGARLAYLTQQSHFSGELTLWEEMEASLVEINQLRQELSELEVAIADSSAPDWQNRMDRYGDALSQFEMLGGYEIENRIERVLQGLGFSEEQYFEQLSSFSGGQKTRAALAAALLSNPDLLLLDEPTNHLDLTAVEWLEEFLSEWQGTLLIVSHDRYFLDVVTKRTIELANGTIDGDYPVPYNHYLLLREERRERQLKEYEAQQDYIAKTEDFIRRYKNGSRSTQARGRERRLERLKEGWTGVDGRVERVIDPPKDQKKLSFNLQSSKASGESVLLLEKLAAGYNQVGQEASSQRNAMRVLVNVPRLEIRKGQRVALMGANGSGKTTMLRTIIGELPALRGSITLGAKVDISYYAQGHERLQPESSMLDELWRVSPKSPEVELRSLLGRFLFTGDDVFKKIKMLSGGERARVSLAQMLLLKGNLLVLDEPTNHLDIPTVEALEEVLGDYDGTLLFVSHDRSFIDAVANTIWMVENGTIKQFYGNYSEYMAKRAA